MGKDKKKGTQGASASRAAEASGGFGGGGGGFAGYATRRIISPHVFFAFLPRVPTQEIATLLLPLTTRVRLLTWHHPALLHPALTRPTTPLPLPFSLSHNISLSLSLRIGFGGFSGSQNLAAAYDDLGGGATVDSDIGRVMKHLLKQSSSTKLKALQELVDTVAGVDTGASDQQER
jgi:hypothetical protein